MSTPEAPTENAQPAPSLDALLALVGHSTQQLLGATVQVTDGQWREPSLLPGWTRGHVATHVARNADGMARLADWARTGERQDMYASEEQRDSDIDAGADRSGLELQVDLDSSAGRLGAALAALSESGRWDAVVEVRGTERPASLLPLMRLGEIALHHVDLDLGHRLADLHPETVGWLLEYAALRLRGRTDLPALEIRGDSGFHAVLGPMDASPRTIAGPDADLLGWLTRRGGADRVTGTDGIALPSFA